MLAFSRPRPGFSIAMAYPIMHEYNRGIGLMVLTTFIFASQDTITKHLAQNMSILQFVGVRFLVFLLFALWWTTRKHPLREVLRVHRPGLQILRGGLLVGEILVFSYAIRWLGVGEMQSLFLAYPLLVTALSPWVLGEEVGWRRWVAICVGFIGTLIIVSPGSASFSVYSVIAVLCAVMFAAYNLLTRMVGRTDSAESSLLYTGIMGALVSVPFLPGVWEPIPWPDSGLLAVLCFTGIVSHYLMIQALKLTPAVILQPFNYLVLPWAIVLGYLFFDEIIPLYKWLGIALVAGAGLFVALRQRQIKGL